MNLVYKRMVLLIIGRETSRMRTEGGLLISVNFLKCVNPLTLGVEAEAKNHRTEREEIRAKLFSGDDYSSCGNQV